MPRNPMAFEATSEVLRAQWARAEETAVDVFQALAVTGAKNPSVGASYGFADPNGAQPLGADVPKPGFLPFVAHTGHLSAHAALLHTRSKADWIDRLARSCVPFLQSYQAALPFLQGSLSFCILEVDAYNPNKAVLTVNGTRLLVGPIAFLDKARYLRPATASFGAKDDPVSAYSIEEAVDAWGLARP